MDKLFIYEVNGENFEDYKAFGQAWKDAQKLAREEHCAIFRQVAYDNGTIVNQFYAKGGVFLDERFYSKDKVMIF